MRLVATMLLWLVTTLLLAVAVPAMWVQRNVVSEDGYASFAASAAKDPQLQSAMAAELDRQVISFAADNGYTLNRDMVRRGTDAYTSSAGFPGQFGQANRIAHRWMFTDSVQREEGTDRWYIDIAPMLNDPSIKDLLGDIDLDVPQTLTVPITVPETTGLHPGRLRQVSTWGPWITVGATILTGVFALLTLAASRSRGKTLAALGVSALIVGAAGWAGLEVARGHVNDALNRTTGDIRLIADAVVAHAEDSLHHWLNLTLAAGAALVVFGVLVAMLGGWRRRDT